MLVVSQPRWRASARRDRQTEETDVWIEHDMRAVNELTPTTTPNHVFPFNRMTTIFTKCGTGIMFRPIQKRQPTHGENQLTTPPRPTSISGSCSSPQRAFVPDDSAAQHHMTHNFIDCILVYRSEKKDNAPLFEILADPDSQRVRRCATGWIQHDTRAVNEPASTTTANSVFPSNQTTKIFAKCGTGIIFRLNSERRGKTIP